MNLQTTTIPWRKRFNEPRLARDHKLTVDTAHKFFQRADSPLYARLRKRVVVLNTVEQLWEAPEAVSFKLLSTWFRHVGQTAQRNVRTCAYSQQHAFGHVSLLLNKLMAVLHNLFELQATQHGMGTARIWSQGGHINWTFLPSFSLPSFPSLPFLLYFTS